MATIDDASAALAGGLTSWRDGPTKQQPWKAAHGRDYGWLSQLMAEHYAGDDTNVKVLAAGILAA